MLLCGSEGAGSAAGVVLRLSEGVAGAAVERVGPGRRDGVALGESAGGRCSRQRPRRSCRRPSTFPGGSSRRYWPREPRRGLPGDQSRRPAGQVMPRGRPGSAHGVQPGRSGSERCQGISRGGRPGKSGPGVGQDRPPAEPVEYGDLPGRPAARGRSGRSRRRSGRSCRGRAPFVVLAAPAPLTPTWRSPRPLLPDSGRRSGPVSRPGCASPRGCPPGGPAGTPSPRRAGPA